MRSVHARLGDGQREREYTRAREGPVLQPELPVPEEPVLQPELPVAEVPNAHHELRDSTPSARMEQERTPAPLPKRVGAAVSPPARRRRVQGTSDEPEAATEAAVPDSEWLPDAPPLPAQSPVVEQAPASPAVAVPARQEPYLDEAPFVGDCGASSPFRGHTRARQEPAWTIRKYLLHLCQQYPEYQLLTDSSDEQYLLQKSSPEELRPTTTRCWTREWETASSSGSPSGRR